MKSDLLTAMKVLQKSMVRFTGQLEGLRRIIQDTIVRGDKRNMKHKLFMLLVIFVCGVMLKEARARSQNRENLDKSKNEVPAVSLTGEIISSEISCGSYACNIKFKLKMSLKNTGEVPIIFLKNHFLFLSLEMVEKPEDFKTGKAIDASYAGMSCHHTSREWIELRRRLEKSAMPSEETFILMPKEEKVFENVETVGVGVLINPCKGISPEERERPSWEQVKNLSEVWIRVGLEVYPDWGVEYKCGGDRLAKKLRKRWKEYGYFWTDYILSEPIRFDMKSAVEEFERGRK